MKTFSQFILECNIILQEREIAWNTGRLSGSGKSPADTAKQRISQVSRRRESDPEKIVATAQRVKKMKTAVAGADEIAKVKDPRTSRTSGMVQRSNTGYASKPKDTRGRTGSLPNISSPSGELPGTSVGGRFGDRRSGRSGESGGNIRNKATNRSGGHLGRKH